MYRITLSEQARKEYLYFSQSDNKAILNKIAALLNDIAEHPYTGLGKPEPLKYELAGKWSRRISVEHRLVYSVNDDIIEVHILYEISLFQEVTHHIHYLKRTSIKLDVLFYAWVIYSERIVGKNSVRLCGESIHNLTERH